MPQSYPLQFRESAIKKSLTGQSSKKQIANELGVGVSTVQRWVRIARKSGEPFMAKEVTLNKQRTSKVPKKATNRSYWGLEIRFQRAIFQGVLRV